MGITILDASVVIGLLDSADPHHAGCALAVRKARAAGDLVVLPASAFAETLVGASRLGPGAVGQTEAFVDAIVDQVHNIDRDAAKAAAKIRAEHRSIRLPDALVLAVGKVTNATAVVTADEKWARVDPRVQVIT